MARAARRLVVVRALTCALFAACAAAAAWAIYTQLQRDTAQANQAQDAARLFCIARTGLVTHISLETPGHGAFEIIRDGTGDAAWHITAPTPCLAEASTVEALLTSALGLQQTQAVQPAPNAGEPNLDLRIFGLSPPLYRLSLSTGDTVGQSASTQMLSIGKRNNFDGSLFVQRGDRHDVAVVPGSFLAAVDLNLYKLRDKRLVPLAPHDVVDIVRKPSVFGPGYRIARTASGWQLTEPRQMRADTASVEALLTTFASLHGKSVVAESAKEAQLSLFGLQAPRFVVTLGLAADTHAQTQKAAPQSQNPSIDLMFGEIQVKGATHTFARTGDSAGPVWELGSDYVMQQLRQDAAELRDMQVLHVAAHNVAQITVHRAQTHFSFCRSLDKEGTWQPWELGGSVKHPVHASRIHALLAQVTGLKADRIVDETVSAQALKQAGLTRPHAEVDLFDAGGHLLGSLVLGQSDASGVFVATDQKDRLDHITQRAHDEIAAPYATYLRDDEAR